jgi:hypothetical protein
MMQALDEEPDGTVVVLLRGKTASKSDGMRRGSNFNLVGALSKV